MMAPQDVSIFLNNALTPAHYTAELDGDAVLPETIRDMPDHVSGRLVSLDPATVQEIGGAWKRVMILNATRVLYTFTFEPQTNAFTATKR